jgi:hypothetical protein
MSLSFAHALQVIRSLPALPPVAFGILGDKVIVGGEKSSVQAGPAPTLFIHPSWLHMALRAVTHGHIPAGPAPECPLLGCNSGMVCSTGENTLIAEAY